MKDNTGYWNTGNRNTGYSNTGDTNAGDGNTGDRNAGNRNTGKWNTTNYETGYFNTKQSEYVNIFNKPCKREDWENANQPLFIYFNLTEWISKHHMTEEEKEENPTYKTTGGYLKSYDYKEAFQKSYNALSKEEKTKQTQLLKALPNFDKDVFFEISGIDIGEKEPKELTLQEIADKFKINIEDLRIKE